VHGVESVRELVQRDVRERALPRHAAARPAQQAVAPVGVDADERRVAFANRTAPALRGRSTQREGAPQPLVSERRDERRAAVAQGEQQVRTIAERRDRAPRRQRVALARAHAGCPSAPTRARSGFR